MAIHHKQIWQLLSLNLSPPVHQSIAKYTKLLKAYISCGSSNIATTLADTSMASVASSSSSWILDSRASTCMPNDQNILKHVYTSKTISSINIANDNIVLVQSLGTIVTLSSIILHNVLYVLMFTMNLLSISDLTK